MFRSFNNFVNVLSKEPWFRQLFFTFVPVSLYTGMCAHFQLGSVF